MIDKKHIGYAPPTTLWEVEKGRIAFFAKVIGACDPIHTDEAAAKAAGAAYYGVSEQNLATITDTVTPCGLSSCTRVSLRATTPALTVL